MIKVGQLTHTLPQGHTHTGTHIQGHTYTQGHTHTWEWRYSLHIPFQHNSSAAEGGSMPNSPSSMVNQYRLEEDEDELVDASMKDLLVTVDHPESHVTAIETFIVYRVVTKVRGLLWLLFINNHVIWANQDTVLTSVLTEPLGVWNSPELGVWNSPDPGVWNRPHPGGLNSPDLGVWKSPDPGGLEQT